MSREQNISEMSDRLRDTETREYNSLELEPAVIEEAEDCPCLFIKDGNPKCGALACYRDECSVPKEGRAIRVGTPERDRFWARRGR